KEADVTYKSPIALTEEDLKEQEEREKADKKKAVKEREEELKRQEEKRLLEEDIKKQDEKRINAKRNVFVNSDKEEVKGKDPETVKKNAVKMTIELQKNQVDYDTKELKRNKAAYETGMKKIQSEMVALKKNKILTDAQKQRIKELEAHSARMVHEFAASKKVYIRDAVDIEIKKKVGYKVMMSLSEFESVFKFDEMSRLVSQYGEKQNGRAIALKSLFDKLLGINAEPMELLDDKRFTMCLEKYEQLSGMTEAFKRLLKMNPDFEVGMKGEERKRLQTLDDMSSLFRVKKQILLDPSYRAKVPVDLSSYPKSKEVFAKSHYRRMLAVSKVLERNLRLAAGLPLFDNELKKQENPFAEADRLYALRLSKEPAFQNESKAGCEKLREQTSKKNQIILSKIEKIQESLKTAKGDDRDNKIGQLKELMLKSDLLNERMKKELQDDPSARIYDAIRIIEEERFQLPQDYNMIPDLLHVPEKKTGALSLTCLFQEVTNKELKAKADTNDAMCKRYGYQEFEKWMRDYAAKYFNKQYGDITFGHSKTTDPSIIYNDNLDRILTHFKGSHHLFRTDAEMREQIMALSFDRSPMRKAWQDDPEKMQYMEEMFHQKVYMLNRQMINAAARIMNGGGSRLILMTPVDKIMTMNAYLKMEILACCTSTNVIVGANYANYLEALKKNNPEEVATLDPDGYFVANMISNVPLGFHGFINMRGEKGCTDLPKAYHKEYKTFIEKYMKKHKCSSVAAGQAFMMAHPEIWDNKKAWIQPVDDKEAEESRLEEMMDRTAAQFTIPDESAELYQSDSFEPVSQKELDAYKEKIKDQGFKNYDKALDVINGGFRTMTPSEMAATYFM
ncbi:hypothetical protein, partial [Butyrivibrio sp. YAB3001]|uniref:hypothetical protein n=1 Tax=Butyrivibrio sp. YAB3001 TaxID=1520812 RepID=UPI0008F669C4